MQFATILTELDGVRLNKVSHKEKETSDNLTHVQSKKISKSLGNPLGKLNTFSMKSPIVGTRAITACVGDLLAHI